VLWFDHKPLLLAHLVVVAELVVLVDMDGGSTTELAKEVDTCKENTVTWM
jgi:hypothetical protein